MTTKEMMSKTIYDINLTMFGKAQASSSRGLYESGWDAALFHAPEVVALVKVARIILKEWEKPTEGVLPGELIARLSQYSVEAREALRPFEEVRVLEEVRNIKEKS